MSFDFTLDDAGWRDFERENRDLTAQWARDLAERSSDNAPEHTGHAKRSYKSEGDVFYTDDFAGHIIEFGSVNNPPYRPMTNAVKDLGFDLDDRGDQ